MTKRNFSQIAERVLRHGALVLFLCLAAMQAGCGGGGGGVVGNRGGDVTSPVLAMTSPAQAGRVSDVAFRDPSFFITVNYSDASAMDMNTIQATLKMDGAAAQDITSYFAKVNETTLRTEADFYEFTRSLFSIQTNDTSRVMTLALTIKDAQQNAGTLSTTFTVYPDGPAAP